MLGGLDFPNPEDELLRLSPTQKILMISANEDEFIPKESTEKLIKVLKTLKNPVSFKETKGGHILPGSKGVLNKLLKLSESWMINSKLI